MTAELGISAVKYLAAIFVPAISEQYYTDYRFVNRHLISDAADGKTTHKQNKKRERKNWPLTYGTGCQNTFFFSEKITCRLQLFI